MDSNSGKRLLRAIRVTVADPWQIFGTLALLVAIFAIAVVLVNAQNLRAQLKRGIHEFTIVAVTTPQPPTDRGPVDESPAPAPAPAPPPSTPPETALTGQQSAPTAASRATAHATPRHTATPTPTPTTNTGPHAALRVTPSGLSVIADASGSTGGTGNLTYRFDFQDGYVSGPGPSSVASHTYSTWFQYTITVIVTDSAGNWDQATQTVILRP